MSVKVATSSVYRCESCGAVYSKHGNGAMSKFKNHLDSHSQNRAFFKVVLGANNPERISVC